MPNSPEESNPALEELKNKWDRLSQQYATHSSLQQRLLTEVQRLLKDNKALKSSDAEKNTEINELKEQLKTEKSRSSTLEKKQQQLNIQVASLTAQISELTDQLNTEKLRSSTLQEIEQQLNIQVTSLTARNELLDVEVLQMQMLIDQLTLKIETDMQSLRDVMKVMGIHANADVEVSEVSEGPSLAAAAAVVGVCGSNSSGRIQAAERPLVAPKPSMTPKKAS